MVPPTTGDKIIGLGALLRIACSTGVFFWHANDLLMKAHVETRKEGRKWGES